MFPPNTPRLFTLAEGLLQNLLSLYPGIVVWEGLQEGWKVSQRQPGTQTCW